MLRGVPSDSLRDGVLIYGCADPSAVPGDDRARLHELARDPAGSHGMTPDQLTAVDPLHLGPSLAAMDVFNQYPSPNDPGLDGHNIMGYRFASPIKNEFNTYIGRVDYRISPGQSLFGRFNYQRDAVAERSNSRTGAAHDAEGAEPRLRHRPRLGAVVDKINTFRYGFTDIVEDSIGQQTETPCSFRFIDDFNPLTPTFGRETPTHNIVDDFSWIKGNHTLKFGTNLRFTRVPRYDNTISFNSAITNASWMLQVGTRYAPGNSCPGTEAACAALPAVGEDFQATFADSWRHMLGIVSETDLSANYLVDGTVLGSGDPVLRKYGSDEYEFYAQDSWKIGQNLTVTAGLRYSLFSPPWETNGQQVAPEHRPRRSARSARREHARRNSRQYRSADQFRPRRPRKRQPGFYDWDKNNFAPRFAAAWTPKADGGFFGWLTGGDKMVIRGGYSLVYDRIGQALATRFDQVGSFGLSTQLSSPVNENNEDNPDIRFQGINVIPSTLPAAPPGGFPQTPPVGETQITSALDSSIKTPVRPHLQRRRRTRSRRRLHD